MMSGGDPLRTPCSLIAFLFVFLSAGGDAVGQTKRDLNDDGVVEVNGVFMEVGTAQLGSRLRDGLGQASFAGSPLSRNRVLDARDQAGQSRSELVAMPIFSRSC